MIIFDGCVGNIEVKDNMKILKDDNEVIPANSKYTQNYTHGKRFVVFRYGKVPTDFNHLPYKGNDMKKFKWSSRFDIRKINY